MKEGKAKMSTCMILYMAWVSSWWPYSESMILENSGMTAVKNPLLKSCKIFKWKCNRLQMKQFALDAKEETSVCVTNLEIKDSFSGFQTKLLQVVSTNCFKTISCLILKRRQKQTPLGNIWVHWLWSLP